MGHDATPVGGRRRKETLRGPEASEVGADGRGDAAQRGHNQGRCCKAVRERGGSRFGRGSERKICDSFLRFLA
jgi:hypothetical protein